MFLVTFLSLLLTAFLLGYLFIKRRFSYWADRGIPSIPPVFPVGNLVGFSSKLSPGEIFRDLYFRLKIHKMPICGIYFFINPAAFVTDLDELKNIFVKEFQSFHDRGIYLNEKDDPLSANLVALEGEKWKNLRSKLTPTFTSGKLKFMHSTILQVAERFRDHLEQQGGEVEIKELLAQFTTDVIGSVAFGLEMNAMKDKDNQFRTMGKKIFETSPIRAFKRVLSAAFPEIAIRLGVRLNTEEVTEFFMQLIQETIEYRERNQVTRNDFLQLLMQLRDTEDSLTFSEMVAQAVVFYTAGFESSSSTLTYACYELARNPEIQERARKEIQEVLQRHNGVLTYEAAMELTYVEQIINETLRKYPIGSSLRRKCSQQYQIPGTDVYVEKGMAMIIPVMGIHHDPEIYPEPEVFNPERFTKEAVAERHPYAFIPFGKGPRECIGLRFGLMQSRVGLATILSNFRLFPSENTPSELKFNPKAAMLAVSGGVFLGIERLD